MLDALKRAVQQGSLTTGQIDKSVYRILSLKNRYSLSDSPNREVDIAALNGTIKKALETR
ncbi:hypothetical protein D3C75_1104450 [compost metagenome]